MITVYWLCNRIAYHSCVKLTFTAWPKRISHRRLCLVNHDQWSSTTIPLWEQKCNIQIFWLKILFVHLLNGIQRQIAWKPIGTLNQFHSQYWISLFALSGNLLPRQQLPSKLNCSYILKWSFGVIFFNFSSSGCVLSLCCGLFVIAQNVRSCENTGKSIFLHSIDLSMRGIFQYIVLASHSWVVTRTE